MPINIKTNQLAKEYNDRITWMMKYENFGRRCRFLFPPIVRECPNCIRGGSGMSLGIYRPGGSEPFEENMVCPVCLGKGTFEETVTEEDILIVLFDSKQWFSPGNVSYLPDNSAMVIGDRRRTWNKMQQCSRIILNTDVYGEESPFRKSGEIYPVGLFNGDNRSGSRFFYCFVTREGGG